MKKIIIVVFAFFFILLNVKAEGESIVYFNTSTSGSIIIDKGTFEVKESDTVKETSKSITIQNLGTYQSVLASDSDSNYPLYILKINDEYTFSDTKEIAQKVYILSSKIHNISFDDMATDITNCEDLFGYQLINLLKNNVFRMIYYIIPIALILFSTFDFAKLVFSDDKDGLSGAFKRFSRRAIASVLIFLVPTILIFLTNLLGTKEIESCVNTFKTTENITE